MFRVALPTLGAALAFLVMAGEASAMPIPNGGFESDFTGWSTVGSTSIETAAFGIGPTQGTKQALIDSRSGSVSDTTLESFFGLAPGTLDTFASSIVSGSVDAIEGSGIKTNTTQNSGDMLSFDFNFLTNEVTPSSNFNDAAFLVVNDTMLLADTFDTFTFSPTVFSEETGFNPFTHTFTSSGTFSLGFGVVDLGDSFVDSGVLIDDIQSSGVPNPGVFALLIAGLLALGAHSMCRVKTPVIRQGPHRT